MGHNTLGVIPGSRSWRKVVSLLEGAATAEDVIAQSAKAAEKDMLRASSDPVFVEAVRILLNIPLAARSDDFAGALRSAGLPVTGKPQLFDLLAAVTERLDQVARRARSRTDLGELAARSMSSTLSELIGGAAPGLFGITPEDVQAIARRLSWSKGVAELSRQFFGILVGQTLSYWLDRTLADQVGAGRRFATAVERHAFDTELDHYTAEASRIIKEFSGGWYGKTLHAQGGFGTLEAAQFGAVCLKKITQELRRRGERDA